MKLAVPTLTASAFTSSALTTLALVLVSGSVSFAQVSTQSSSEVVTAKVAAVDTPSTQDELPAFVVGIDYRSMDMFLSNFSKRERGRPRIDYEDAKERGLVFIKDYQDYLESRNTSALSDEAQLAYWLNVQNLLVIRGIMDVKKPKNLKRERGTGSKPGKLWTQDQFTTSDGQTLSIADVETLIATRWPDPNVFYGLYQGVTGGPCISTVAYRPDTVRTMLDAAAKHYVNANGVVTPKGNTVHVTPVFDWYKTAFFGSDDTTLIANVRGHAEPVLSSQLFSVQSVDTVDLNYDTDWLKTRKRDRSANKRRSRNETYRPTRAPSPQPRGGGYGS